MKRIDDPLLNDFGTLSQKTGLKLFPWTTKVSATLCGRHVNRRTIYRWWVYFRPIFCYVHTRSCKIFLIAFQKFKTDVAFNSLNYDLFDLRFYKFWFQFFNDNFPFIYTFCRALTCFSEAYFFHSWSGEGARKATVILLSMKKGR